MDDKQFKLSVTSGSSNQCEAQNYATSKNTRNHPKGPAGPPSGQAASGRGPSTGRRGRCYPQPLLPPPNVAAASCQRVSKLDFQPKPPLRCGVASPNTHLAVPFRGLIAVSALRGASRDPGSWHPPDCLPLSESPSHPPPPRARNPSATPDVCVL